MQAFKGLLFQGVAALFTGRGLMGMPRQQVLQGLLWVTVALVFYQTAVSVKALDALETMETSLLDLRLKSRAEGIAPSEDIVIVAMDRATEDYARNHPQMKLTGRVLPRNMLGEVVRYLKAEGARAIILDIEPKEPKPSEDPGLEAAIRESGNVYVASFVDPSFKSRYWEEYQAKAAREAQWAEATEQRRSPAYLRQEKTLDAMLVFRFYLDPYLHRLARLERRTFPGGGAPGLFLLSGLTPWVPLVQFEDWHDLGDYTQFLKHRIGQELASRELPPDVLAPGGRDLNDVLFAFYQHVCTHDNYIASYRQMPEFLKGLDNKGLRVTFSRPPTQEEQSRFTFCYMSPVLPRFLRWAKGMGVTSVDYYQDGFLRDVPILYRGYRGLYFSYLGIRPALDLMGVHTLQMAPEAAILHTKDWSRRVDLIEEEKILINWRNPALLTEKILTTANHRRVAELRNALERRLGKGLWQNTSGNMPWLEPLLAEAGVARPQAYVPDLRATLARNADLAADPNRRISAVLDALPAEQQSAAGYVGMAEIAYHKGRTRSDGANDILGSGHLYRLVSAIDILKRVRGLPDTADSSLYHIPGQPASGDLSFKGKVVVYGDTIKDIHRTPMGKTTYGPEVVATVVDMMLHDEAFIRKPPPWLTVPAVLAVCTLIILAIVLSSRMYLGLIMGVILIAAFWAYNFLAFTYMATWVPLVVPMLAMLASLVGGTVYKYYIHDREKRQLTSVFSKYVSPQVMGEILANPDKAMDNLKGSKKELTVLFSDIKRFTDTFEGEDPERMVEQLNEYFDVMTNIILKWEGTYDKYMGDAIMAFFGAPIDLPDHALRACNAALEMQKALRVLNKKWVIEGKKVLDHGIGISSGSMFVGNFGSQAIKNFTVMGSTVNLGARLEACTREVDSDIIISKRTRELVGDQVPVQGMGEIAVKGFSEPVPIFGLKET